MVRRRIWAFLYTVVFDGTDCYMMLLLVTANFLFYCFQHCELSGQARSTLVMTVSPDGWVWAMSVSRIDLLALIIWWFIYLFIYLFFVPLLYSNAVGCHKLAVNWLTMGEMTKFGLCLSVWLGSIFSETADWIWLKFCGGKEVCPEHCFLYFGGDHARGPAKGANT